MFGLDTVKLLVVGGLVTATVTAGYSIYHGIQASEAAKIELQQTKLVAAAQHEQDQRSIDALQQTATLAAAQVAQLDQLKEALHAAPVSRTCLVSPAGRAFSVWVRNNSSSGPGAATKAAPQSVAVPGSAAHTR